MLFHYQICICISEVLAKVSNDLKQPKTVKNDLKRSKAGLNLTFKKGFVSFSKENDCTKLILNTVHGWVMKRIFLSRLLKTSELYLVSEDFCKKGLF